MDTAQPEPIYLDDYKSPDFLVETVALEFDLGEAETRVLSRLSVVRQNDADTPLVLDGEDLTLDAGLICGLSIICPDDVTLECGPNVDTTAAVTGTPEAGGCCTILFVPLSVSSFTF